MVVAIGEGMIHSDRAVNPFPGGDMDWLIPAAAGRKRAVVFQASRHPRVAFASHTH